MRRDQALRTKAYRALIRYRSPEEIYQMWSRRLDRTVQRHADDIEDYRQKVDAMAVFATEYRRSLIGLEPTVGVLAE